MSEVKNEDVKKETGGVLTSADMSSRSLSPAEFARLGEVPPEAEWYANIDNPRTREAYAHDTRDFIRFLGLDGIAGIRSVTRAHVIAWRKDLEARGLVRATIRRKLSAVSSLFQYLCEANAVPHNPVNGAKRPAIENPNEGKTPAISDAQARALLDVPDPSTIKGMRDRAILAVLLFHGLRRAEVSSLAVGDVEYRRGVAHFRVLGKGGKIRYIPVHPQALRLIGDCLEAHGRGADPDDPLFRSLRDRRERHSVKAIDPRSILRNVVKHYASAVGINANGFCAHSLRATAATNALENSADIAKVQEWLGHANVSTTRLYDRRKTRPEDSPTFAVRYGQRE